MLVPALRYEHALKSRFVERILEPDTRFLYFQSYLEFELTVDRNDWKRIQFVSVSPSGELLAYLEARLNRESSVVEDLLVLSLRGQGLNFEASGDVFRFLAYLFVERGFRKIFFRFVRDNPAARQYRRLVESLARCGTVQGVLQDYLVLADARVYDLVIMDIQRDPFLGWFRRRYALHSAD